MKVSKLISQVVSSNSRLQGEKSGLPMPCKFQTCLVNSDHPLRDEVENFVASKFASVHRAVINNFMPTLLTLLEDGEVRGVVGVRSAKYEKLFLEHYLDDSIEQAISRRAAIDGVNPLRRQIVEIGNLASVNAIASQRLFRIIARYLIQHDYKWLTFTGCRSLRHIFSRMNFNLHSLGPALESRVPASQGCWGSYYHDQPEVLVGLVSGGRAVAENTSYSLLQA